MRREGLHNQDWPVIFGYPEVNCHRASCRFVDDSPTANFRLCTCRASAEFNTTKAIQTPAAEVVSTGDTISGMRIIGLLALAAIAVQMPRANAADFTKWWPQFRASVARRDIPAVAEGASFPIAWENGPTRKIASLADLKARFDDYFTSEITNVIATKKPQRLANGFYIITWQARGNEYSIMFKPVGAAFAPDSLSEGPP